MGDQAVGQTEFGPRREPVGAGDGNTYVVRECGRCTEVHAEVTRLRANIEQMMQHTAGPWKVERAN